MTEDSAKQQLKHILEFYDSLNLWQNQLYKV